MIEIQIAGTSRECECTKRYWNKREKSSAVKKAEEIWQSKNWDSLFATIAPESKKEDKK